jgi:hypothetical protein
MEFSYYFVFRKNQLLIKRNNRVPTQLSYSVNESHREDAVHGGAAGIMGQKHVAIRLSIPKETPYES